MQDLGVTATRDHNVYASFHPSIVTKDAETRSKMNSATGYLCRVGMPIFKKILSRKKWRPF